MHAVLFAVLSSGPLAADVPPPEEEGVLEYTELQGTWMVVALIEDGGEVPEDPTDGQLWTFRGNKYVASYRSQIIEEKCIILDPSGHSAAITFKHDNGVDTERGIYCIRGDKLEIAFVTKGPVPTHFVSEKGSGVYLFTLRRVKK